jgi:hypothetical protein
MRTNLSYGISILGRRTAKAYLFVRSISGRSPPRPDMSCLADAPSVEQSERLLESIFGLGVFSRVVKLFTLKAKLVELRLVHIR